MAGRRSSIPLALLASATAAAWSCADPSPLGVDHRPPSLVAARSGGQSSTTGLVRCSQSYDSVTKVIGPAGGFLAVGSHILYVDSLALSTTVSITAVAPADTLRRVRLQPDGLVFQTTVDGWSALLYTNYTDCSVPTNTTLRMAQVSDDVRILGYVQTYSKTRKNPWSRGAQYVAGMLDHFSNYAVAW